MAWNRRNRDKPERIDYDAAKAEAGGYSKKELEILADQFLRDDANVALECSCPPPEKRAKDKKGNPVACRCKKRGIDGEHAILFEDHLHQRRKREIYNANGIPDPEIVSGIFNRTHPQGRKVNTDEQRKRNGASFYR